MCVSSLEGAVLTTVPIGYLTNDNHMSSKESIQLSGPLLNMQVCLDHSLNFSLVVQKRLRNLYVFLDSFSACD